MTGTEQAKCADYRVSGVAQLTVIANTPTNPTDVKLFCRWCVIVPSARCFCQANVNVVAKIAILNDLSKRGKFIR